MEEFYNLIKDDYNVQVNTNRYTNRINSLKVKISSKSNVYQKCPEADYLSIIIPPDLNIHCYETALYKNSKGVVYCDELGYSDVCRFSDSDEVIKELKRLNL